MKGRLLAAVTVTVLLSAGLAVPAPAAPASAPQVAGGSSALGSPAVVAIATYDGSRWRICSGALLRPRILLTATHCLTKPGTRTPVQRVRVFPPGARAKVYANTGPRRPSPIRVVQWWNAADVERGTQVQPDDVSAILLNGDLGPLAFTRVATQTELARWKAAATPVIHVGYGGTGTRTYSPVPQWVTLPFRSLSTTSLGSTFSTSATPQQSLCAGDSGGPAYVADGTSAYLVGTMAGANGSCASTTDPEPSNLGFTTVGYLRLVNTALVAGGYAPIPSAPQQVGQTARNRDVTVQWRAPALAAEAVVAYDVFDAAGALVCQTAQTSCIVPTLPDGVYAYSVRARNGENEGDAAPPQGQAVIAGPPAPGAPTVVRVTKSRYRVTITTIAGRTSAVVRSYVVRDQSGGVVCTVSPPTPQTAELGCDWSPRRGTYRLTVQADTEMGLSPVSAASAQISVR